MKPKERDIDLPKTVHAETFNTFPIGIVSNEYNIDVSTQLMLFGFL